MRQWLERLVTPLRQPGAAMVFGGQRGHALSKFSEARDFERVFPAKPQVMDDEYVFVNNANSAVRRRLCGNSTRSTRDCPGSRTPSGRSTGSRWARRSSTSRPPVFITSTRSPGPRSGTASIARGSPGAGPRCGSSGTSPWRSGGSSAGACPTSDSPRGRDGCHRSPVRSSGTGTTRRSGS